MTKNSPTLFRKVARAAILIIFILTLVSATRGIHRLSTSGSRVGEAQTKLLELKRQQEGLRAELDRLQSGFYQEKEARDKLGLAREGELVVVLPEESVLRRLSPRKADDLNLETPEPNWQKWAKLFFEI